jgi:hypothetical protein
MRHAGSKGRLFLLAIGFLFAVSCGGDSATTVFKAGDKCDALTAITCGKVGDNDAVLKCMPDEEGTLSWQEHKLCAYGCGGGGKCLLPDGGGDVDDQRSEPTDILDLFINFDVKPQDYTPFEESSCGLYLTPCEEDGDCCDPGLCIQGPDGTVCTKTCYEDCAEGWSCEQVWQGADVLFICVPKHIDTLCDPCYKDSDCNIVHDLCLPIGAGGEMRCSRDCTDDPCPPEFECAEVEDSKGNPSMQCVPIAGACECVGMVPDDYLSDVNNCGTCGIVCAYDNAVPLCDEGDCVMGECLEGYADLNKKDNDGCEYECVVTGEVDKPDMEGLDTNCDGIDGDAEHAIFVTPSGMDIGNQTGNMEHPVKTLAKAISLAAAKEPKWDVYVAQGIYEEQVALVDGVSLYGGFNPELEWDHNPVVYKTTIHWSAPGPGGVITVLAHDIQAATVVEGFHIESGNNDSAGGSSMAVHILGSTDQLVFSHNRIQAGNGANGTPGNDGTDGQPGENGGPGNAGCEYGGNWCAVACSSCDHPAAGKGGKGFCGNTGGTGGKGGGNGSSGAGGSAAEDGAPGGPGGGKKNDGGPGGDGGAGQPGQQGTGGDGLGTVTEAGFWIPTSGTEGTAGTPGTGGGGGGGGGGDDNSLCYCYSYGASGGGGGGGGCAGTPGTGGGGAGGSFAFFVVNSTARIIDNEVVYRFGGNGGNGGKGGKGGPAGLGGSGGPGKQDDNEGGGGKGGNAGKGGDAGSGGGGSGGAAYGIFWTGAQSPGCEDNDFENQGGGGLGGLGGQPSEATNGKNGEQGHIYNPTATCAQL